MPKLEKLYLLYLYLSLTSYFLGTLAQSNSSKIWILLEDANVYQCTGIDNKVEMNEGDVSIRNSRGRQVHYLEAPGEYVLNFNSLRVQEPLPHISGQMNGILQVPLVDFGNSGSWDFPYQLIPEQQLMGGYKCDKAAGVVADGGKNYCRYCDLCEISQEAEQLLNSNGHKYLPQLGSNKEQSFDRICRQIDARTYSMQRTISLPDRKELERQVNAQFKGIGSELKKKLNKGKGKMQMEVQLISSNEPQLDQQAVYAQSAQCRCCMKNVNDLSCKVNFINGGCNQAYCMSEYASQCIRGNAQKVACYTVQYNYQVTDKPEEVRKFLQRNNYDDEFGDFGQSPVVARPPTNPAPARPSAPTNTGARPAGGAATADQRKVQCLRRMIDERYRRYCTIRWQDAVCCAQCGGC